MIKKILEPFVDKIDWIGVSNSSGTSSAAVSDYKSKNISIMLSFYNFNLFSSPCYLFSWRWRASWDARILFYDSSF